MNCVSPKTIWPHRSVEWCDANEEYPVSVPCGKCIPCLVNKRADWSFRLEQEHKVSKSAHFVTLTYDPKHYPSDGSLDVRHLQLYLKRLRKLDTKKNGKSRIRYYAVGEYGSNSGRAHYHILLFNSCEDDIRSSWKDSRGNPIGIVHVGDVTAASVGYVTKYIVLTDHGDLWRSKENPHGLVKPFSVMSRAYGIGAHYLTDEMVAWHRVDDRNYSMRYQSKVRLPRFYREKIWYKPEDRERVSRSAMQLSLNNRLAELRYYERVHGANAQKVMLHARNAILNNVKQKVKFTQSF